MVPTKMVDSQIREKQQQKNVSLIIRIHFDSVGKPVKLMRKKHQTILQSLCMQADLCMSKHEFWSVFIFNVFVLLFYLSIFFCSVSLICLWGQCFCFVHVFCVYEPKIKSTKALKYAKAQPKTCIMHTMTKKNPYLCQAISFFE